MPKNRMLFPMIFSLVIALQAEPHRATPVVKCPIELADIMAWRHMNAWALSDGGVWFAYHIGPTEGDGEVVFRQAQTEREFRFTAGETAGRPPAPTFSPESKFGAFTIYPTHAEAAQLKRQRRPLQNKVGIVNLDTGDKVEVPRIRRFVLAPGTSGWIAMHKYSDAVGGAAPAAPRPPAGLSTQGADLLLRELATGQTIVIGNVSDFAFDKRGRFLAWTIDTVDKAGNGLQVRDMETGAIRSLESDDRATYSRMSWSEDGESLSLLKALEDRTPGTYRYFVMGLTGFDAATPQKTVFNPATSPDFPAGMMVSPNRSPVWTADRSALLFGIQSSTRASQLPAVPQTRDRSAGADPRSAAAPAVVPDDTTPDEKVDLVLWHWQDKRLQSQQQVQESIDRNFSYLAEYRPADRKFIRLADERMTDVAPAAGNRFAIGRDDDSYELMANLDGKRFQDIYVIDLATGRRTLAVRKSRWTYGPSPTGTHFLYYDDGHFYTFDMTTNQATNITKNVPTSFVDVEDDHPVAKPPTQFFGWSTDGRSVLLSDDWDIWQVPVGGGAATNLTLTGKKEQVRCRRPLILDPEQRGFDLSKPIYFELYGEWTKKGGIGLIEPGTPGSKWLVWDDATFAVPALMKARKADVYLYTRQTSKDPPDFYLTDAKLTASRRITNLAAGTEPFLWSSGSILVDYTSTKGDRLQGALFLPANYEKGKSYPTVVNIYEKMSANLHAYTRLTQPNPTTINKALYTSRGYAVFLPDITYKFDDPGMSAVWSVVPAVKAAIATGIVDSRRVGIMGHSWGGYQTAFLITQTDLFAAAVASAPITDFISMSSLIYKATGTANSVVAESSQGRFTAAPWENLDPYLRNSPVLFAKNVKTPVLMLHNDKDGAVDFTQGVEFYNALRRLQKPVVMLEYMGETHGLARRPNGKDFMFRVQEFFDHYLQAKPMPDWYKNGVPWLEMEDHLKSRQAKKANPAGR